MDANQALDFYERIDRIDTQITAIFRRRLPHARMEYGKAEKRGEIEKALKWQNEIERLYLFVNEQARKQSELRTRLSEAGYVPH